MINWFESAGVSKDALKDESTSHFIKDFIDEHGGFEAIKKDVERKKTIKRGKFFHCIPISAIVLVCFSQSTS